MAAKGDTPKKPAKEAKRSGTSINDTCRFCCCPLKIKYGGSQKTSYISTQNLFKVSKRDGFHFETLALNFAQSSKSFLWKESKERF